MVTTVEIELDELVQPDRIHGRVYHDQAVFDLEMEKIYGRSWVFLGHESEIAEGGDYKTTYIGLQPVIVSRSADDGAIYVLLNRCRHRAATVCNEGLGNSSYFRCSFHGWTYSNNGDLVGVTHPKGYDGNFEIERMGLTRAPRVGTYRGFIFASLAAEGPSLEEHLGNVRPILDVFVDQSPTAEVKITGRQTYQYEGNWKWEMENDVDGYHVAFLHHSLVQMIKRTMGINIAPHYEMSSPVRTLYLGNGHVAIYLNPPGAAANEAYGRLLGFPYTVGVFPNLSVIGVSVRYHRPLSPLLTETTYYATSLGGLSDEQNEACMRSFELMDGRAGIVTPDDGEIFDRQNLGLQARAEEWMVLSRGIGQEHFRDDGVVEGDVTSECATRGFYQHWKSMLAAG